MSVVWLKRDLRLRDHEPLQAAASQGFPILLLYIFEPMLMADRHYSVRHWRFVWQSIMQLNMQLVEYNAQVLVVDSDAESTFSKLAASFEIKGVYSHEEVGLKNTFDRDLSLKTLFASEGISWFEYQTGAVRRGLLGRTTWDKQWHLIMRGACADVELSDVNWLSKESIIFKNNHFKPRKDWEENHAGFQPGGEIQAWQTLNHFLELRGQKYAYHISSPSKSRKSCSRMSAYLAWGNISLRQVYQRTLLEWNKQGWRRSLVAFVSRLHWHCHFIQKFESECEMEFRHVNRAYERFPYLDKNKQSSLLSAWQNGTTGYPLVDAAMRCLLATGYVNFRMRAMLVSFLCHHLNIDWRFGVEHLASLFLDFEPGIHYSQFQMQAGVTGANTIRIYNPVKQSQEKDPEGLFIKRWLPELGHVPVPLIHEPWLLSDLEMMMYQVKLGDNYPLPIVDIQETGKRARDLLWQYRKREDVRQESKRIISKHVVPNRRKQSGFLKRTK